MDDINRTTLFPEAEQPSRFALRSLFPYLFYFYRTILFDKREEVQSKGKSFLFLIVLIAFLTVMFYIEIYLLAIRSMLADSWSWPMWLLGYPGLARLVAAVAAFGFILFYAPISYLLRTHVPRFLEWMRDHLTGPVPPHLAIKGWFPASVINKRPNISNSEQVHEATGVAQGPIGPAGPQGPSLRSSQGAGSAPAREEDVSISDTDLDKKLPVGSRQRAVFDVLRQHPGISNQEIGEKLHIGESTVKTHLLRAFDKLELKGGRKEVWAKCPPSKT